MAKESKRENERLAFDRYTFELWFSPLDDVLFCIRRGLQLEAQLMGGYTHEFGGRTHFFHPSSRSGDSFVDVRL